MSMLKLDIWADVKTAVYVCLSVCLSVIILLVQISLFLAVNVFVTGECGSIVILILFCCYVQCMLR